jgi:hypothetical protein
MIRSGLANVQNAGYLGYPHDREKNPRNDVERPFVSIGDETILKKSDLSDPLANSVTVPAPIMYNDIFAKRTTPDERVYVLKQIQQGLEKIQKGLLGKESRQVPTLPLPSQPGNGPTFPPAGQPSSSPTGGSDGGPMEGDGPNTGDTGGSTPNLIGESPITAEDELELEEEAQDVVANPQTTPTATQEERAFDEWLHMQHSPQWRQIEGRTFNTSARSSSFHSANPGSASTQSTEFGSATSYRGPDSGGSYGTPSPQYPTLPPLYPDLAMTPTSDGHRFTRTSPTQRPPAEMADRILSAASEELPAYSSPSPGFRVNQSLNVIHRALQGLNIDQQRELLLSLSLEQRQNIARAMINNPNHPITGEPIIQAEIPRFAPPPNYVSDGSASLLSTPSPSLYSPPSSFAGTTRSYSTITPSPRSIPSTISSNGVGPRSRNDNLRSADSRMSVPMSEQSAAARSYGPPTRSPISPERRPPPQRRRANAPPPIDTQLPAQRNRDRTNYRRPGRPQTLADVDRLTQNGLRPQGRRNYFESPPS